MKNKINRREFLRATAAAGALAASSTKALGAPAIIRESASKPVVISSGNGNVYRNGGSETCVELAFRKMMAGDDVLDSLIAGVNIVELDPTEPGVGFGGLPGATPCLEGGCRARGLRWDQRDHSLGAGDDGESGTH